MKGRKLNITAFKTCSLLAVLVTLSACSSRGVLLAEAASPDGGLHARLLSCADPASFRGRELVGVVFDSQGTAPACQETNLPNVRAWFAATAPQDQRTGSVEWVGSQARFTLSGNHIKTQSPPPTPDGLILIVGSHSGDDGS